MWGLTEEIVVLKEGVFFRKFVCLFVCLLVGWLCAEEQRRCIRNFRVSHNKRCTWFIHKTRTNIADADSLFDTPCIILWQQHSFNKQASSLQRRPANLPAELLDTAHSCSRHGVAADRLSSERPGSVTAISKTQGIVEV